MFRSIVAFSIAALAPEAGQASIVVDGQFADWNQVDIMIVKSNRISEFDTVWTHRLETGVIASNDV